MKINDLLKKTIQFFCLISVFFLSVFFFLSPVISFANVSDFRLPYVYLSSSTPNRTEVQQGVKLYQNKNSSVGGMYLFTSSTVPNAVCGGNMNYLFIACASNSSSVYYSFLYSTGVPNSHKVSFTAYHGYYIFSVAGSFSNDMSECFNYYETESDFLNECDLYFGFTTPTPEPTPSPEPTPTPAPTFNPYAPTYTTFFERLTNDANSALNALYLGWQQANNKFYTGIFFIGIPVLLGIFGLVASIFFGGGSDE